MSETLRHQIILLFTCGLVFFVNLGASRLFDEDEPKNAECGREMFERSDWIVPTYNYDLRTDKPIMLYWLMLSSFSVLGVSEFAARLPSACMATITIFSVYAIGLRLFNKRVGFWAAIMLGTSLMYVTIGRISTPDSTLIGFITLSLLVYVYAVPKSTWQGSNSANQSQKLNPLKPVPEFFPIPQKETSWPQAVLPNRWVQFALLYGIMGLAVLTKGPVGFLLPCVVIGLFVMCLGRCPRLPLGITWRKPFQAVNEVIGFVAAFFSPSRFLPSLWAMRPLTLILVIGAVALPWYVSVSIATDGAWLQGFLGNHNIGRFSSAMEGHSGPIFYYVIAIMMGFFPWSVFLPVALYQAIFQRESAKQEHRSLTFLLCWIGVYVAFFSIAQTKLPNYILPCYPPLALLTAWMLVRWQEETLELPSWSMKWSSCSLIITGVTLAIAFPIASVLLMPGYL
ncbi:MAG: glycosyltransferase family 39 protein, partial [Planctomycetaceae bacterium]|nr:glycosyltransferase family 39 protein [Planctomycetaceae bacterium]